MITRLIKTLSRSSLAFRIALFVLPISLRITGSNGKLSRIAYRVYSVLPRQFTLLGSKAAHQTANLLIHRPYEAALHRAMAYRFEFDAGNHLELWQTRAEELLTQCDNALEDGVEISQLADLLLETLSILFHPSIHQGLRTSPFVDQPKATGSLLAYECLKLLRAGPANILEDFKQEVNPPSSDPMSDTRPHRILVLTDTNFNFMGTILGHWKLNPKLQIRARNLLEEGIGTEWWNIRNVVVDRIKGNFVAAPDFLKDDLEWADVIFVEWNQALAARLSGMNLSAKLVIRLHKYEAFIPIPTLTNWNSVECLITITPYMRQVLKSTVPNIETRTSIEYVPNVVDLAKFQRPKLPEASKTIALIQYGLVVKDPLWALEVLRILREEDTSWNLSLIGSEPDLSTLDEASVKYFEEFDRQVHHLGSAVKRLGHQSELAETLRHVGVILSSSQVEGAPVSVQEAVASGALPVVRDWPIVKAIGGAASLYPSEWIVQSPLEAADRIRDWSLHSRGVVDEADTRTWMVENQDASVSIAKLTSVVSGCPRA